MLGMDLEAHDRTKLLVSVRNLEEAMVADKIGVDVLDFKEPINGALGRVDAATLANILNNDAWQSSSRMTSLSCALGELGDLAPHEIIEYLQIADPNRQLKYVKVGLAGANELADWRASWLALRNGLPPDVELVAVAYADPQNCSSPPIDQILELAFTENCSTILIDTFSKSGVDITSHCSMNKLQEYCGSATLEGAGLCLAGSVNINILSQLMQLKPSYIGIRGAACSKHDRSNSICESALRDFKNEMQHQQLRTQSR